MVWYIFWMSVTCKRYRIVDTEQSGSHGCFPTVASRLLLPDCLFVSMGLVIVNIVAQFRVKVTPRIVLP